MDESEETRTTDRTEDRQMSQPPLVDDRNREELETELVELADQYVDDWNPESEDMASLLLSVGAEFGGEVVQRLNRLPEKHRAGLLETLGRRPRPPQAAQLPLSVEPTSDLDRNVRVPGGTQATATTRDDESTVFEIPPDSGFEATSASLAEVYAVDPSTDRLTSHASLANGDRSRLFVGESHQQHALYLGDDSLFELDSGAVLELELGGFVGAIEDNVVWEYYGTARTEDKAIEEGVNEPGATEDGANDDETNTDTEGWHRLPAVEPADESLQDRVDRLAATPQADDGTYTTRRRLPGEFVETSVGEIESRWLRCRVVEPTVALFATEIDTVSIATSQPQTFDHAPPDGAFVDDVPLAVDGEEDIEPLGQFPQPSSTLYLAREEALTKPGAEIQVQFEPPAAPYEQPEPADDEPAAEFGALESPPRISWEYWNGSGWARLAVDDDTENLQQAGELTFVVPDDVASTVVSGQEAHWIRGRLVGGSYGNPAAALAADSEAHPERPQFGGIGLAYDHPGGEVSHLVAENNAEVAEWSTDDSGPFRPPYDESQTVYCGFDGEIRDGPIPLFVPLAEAEYPNGFDPAVQWEYCVDPETDSWSRLAVEDGTNSLTERGTVRLRFSESTQPFERFGTECHWIRAVVTGDQFEPPHYRPSEHSDSSGRRLAGEQTGKQIGKQTSEQIGKQSTAVSTHRATTERPPPTVNGLYPNTGWADNARTVEDEILGSSDGSANQRFACAHGPLLSCELWVDESSALSKAEQAELEQTDPERVKRVTDDRGEQTAVWVRWRAVDGPLSSYGDERVYRLDRTDGTVQFGDGDCGAVPPQGVDSIRATYRTGGGPGGNVPAGAIETLKTPISLVESVDNPFGASGGAPIESRAAVAERAAGEIRSRGRAVTASDYEQVAASAVRNLARVECQPNRGPTGDRKPGWIRLVVVPEADRERPTPSVALESRLEQAICEVAPARLTSGETKLSVCGPNYARCDIEATLGVDHPSHSQLTTTVDERLAAFLHPVDGRGGEGWAFGESPTREAIERVLQRIEGVTEVRALSVRLRVDGERRRLRAPRGGGLPADGLVCAGSSRLTLEVDNEQ